MQAIEAVIQNDCITKLCMYSGTPLRPSCEITPLALEKRPFRTGGLSSGVEISTFIICLDLQVKWAFQGGWSQLSVVSQKGFHYTLEVFAIDTEY